MLWNIPIEYTNNALLLAQQIVFLMQVNGNLCLGISSCIAKAFIISVPHKLIQCKFGRKNTNLEMIYIIPIY